MLQAARRMDAVNTTTRFPFSRSACLSALLGALASCPAAAEEDVFFSSLPVVASVSRLPQQLSETPASVTVIDQEMIRASGMRTVEDLLRLVPGFQVTSHNQDSAIVAYHGLSYGLSSEEYGPRVQVLVDGRSQYSPLFKSGVNWNLLPVALENIERIEVIRGSNTVSYGSNAFMGVVNIITMDPALTKGWMVSANHGNNGIRDEILRWGGSVGEANLRFTARSFQDDGFQYGFYSGRWTYSPDSRQSQLFDLRADIPLNDRDELQLTGTFARDMSQFGRPANANDPVRNMEQSSAAFGILWRRIVSATEEIKLRYGYRDDRAQSPYRTRINFTTNLAVPASVTFFPMIDPGGRSQQHELELEHLLSPRKDLRMMWGTGLKSTAVQSYEQFSSDGWKSRFAYRVFGNLEYRAADPLIFNVGASYEHDSISGAMFDPRISASFHVMPGHTLRLVASRAHRNPSLYETSGHSERRDVGNTGLADVLFHAQGVKPEQIDTLELGYLAELKEYRAMADVRIFSERIPNYIQILPLALPASSPDDREIQSLRMNAVNYAVYPNGRADSAVNLANVRIQGYEYQLNWRPFEATRLMYGNALVTISADYTDISRVADDFNNGPKIINQTRDSAPTHSQTAMLVQRLPYDVTASIMYFRASPMRWRRNDNVPIDASERIDWRLAKGFRLGQLGGEVAYVSQMINEQQQGRTINRLADRVHWLALRLEF
ncbi:TonB-dependent receptor [uncultured Dechloromonas sp.]|uniref:TonB-dependent receptor plug domain-containing protein n=1 Tax=uncultured Dechloromonas sp. TaxID=171719 RepID=UPI0025E7AF4B|nr:TonB-dependent receptor [uncultured Dechloromonas sp.]